ncbi:YhdP family protein [Pararhodospirillum oryzae]|uniref:YhdP family protein n=1 Tax=Pararhodospirillum oryzae TaxID=478448 RepID=UPI0011BF882F|nr:AsmA-like C-terminal domain-containing protein [Pararhodospirillum oryzae]
MLHGSLKVMLRGLGVVGVMGVLALVGAAWRLQQGPVILDFLAPVVESSVAEALTGQGLVVRVGGVRLFWAGWHEALDLRGIDIDLRTPDGRPLARMPELALSLAPAPLLEGRVVITALEGRGLVLDLVRHPDGRVDLGGKADPGPEPADETGFSLAGLLDGAPAADGTGLGALPARLGISDALIRLGDETGTPLLSVEVGEASFQRAEPAGALAVHAALTVTVPEAAPVAVDLGVGRASGTAPVDLSLNLADVTPAALVRLLAGLGHAGDLARAFDPWRSGHLDVRARARVDALALARGEGRAALAGATFRVEARDLTVAQPDPQPFTWVFPRVVARGEVGPGADGLDLTSAWIDLDDHARVGITARLGDLGHAPTATVEARLTGGLALDGVLARWPEIAAPGAREWIAANLSQGRIREARFTAALAAGPDGLALAGLDGVAEIEGMSIDYRAPLPPLEQVTGTVGFSPSAIGVLVHSGRVRGLPGLVLEGGNVVFSGLDQEDQFADIEAQVQGPVSEALALIDHDPFGYARAVGLDPARVAGEAETSLTLAFPLLKTLTFEQIALKVAARLERVGLPGVVLGHDLEAGTLALTLDPAGMDVKGTATLAGVPARLTWRENFGDGRVTSRYHVQGTVSEARRAALGLVLPDQDPPMAVGPLPADLTVTREKGGKTTLEGVFDLAPLTLTLAPFDWRKPAGRPGRMRIGGRFSPTKATLDVAVDAGADLRARASVSLDPDDASPRLVDIQELAVGPSWVKGTVIPAQGAGATAVTLTDGILDLRPVRAWRAAQPPDQSSSLPALTCDIRLARLRLGETAVLENVSATLSRSDTEWRQAVVHALVPGGPFLNLTLGPSGTERAFVVNTTDGGGVLRGLGVFDSLKGGPLRITGRIEESGTVRGQVEMNDFRLTQAPLMARLLSLAGLTGILDALGGPGIGFIALRVPFVYEDPVLVLSEARTYGLSLGLTAKGSLNLESDALALEGTLVPAYALNGLLGQIPLVGKALVGGEGEGLIGVTYQVSGTLDEPDVSVNPLSALTPGFLRGIFSLFDSPEQTARDAPGKEGG